MDIIDFTNKPAQQFRYILVIVDNFSRFMMVETLTNKTEKTKAVGVEKVLERIKRKIGYFPKCCLTDGGGEFKGDTNEVFLKI